MTPLVDSDIFLYEVGFGSETGWKAIHPESTDPPPFDYVKDMVDERIKEICNKIHDFFGVCDKPRLFLTGEGNFRLDIAKKKPYKGTRVLPKPFHYSNIKAYLQMQYEAEIVEGMEADDMLCILQTDKTIICTRDKDLRQCPGWHFGWELGKQAQYGPLLVDEPGSLSLSADKKKLVGTGSKFFFAQCLMGDNVDNIPGLPQNGPVSVYNRLNELQEYGDMERAVSEAYRAFYGDTWKEEMLEQARLVWMVKQLDDEGNPVMWDFIDGA